MNAPIKNSIAALAPELTEWRRDFHRHPELLYQCNRTAGVVAQRLRDFGFDEVHEGIGKTGVVGLLHGAGGPAKGADKRVLLRADMDALPILEASGAAHASQTPGTMHACGHDGHTTLLLGAAKHLVERPRFRRHAGVLLPARRGGRRGRAGDDRRRTVRALSGQGRLWPAQLAGAADRQVRRGARGGDGLRRPHRDRRARQAAATARCRISPATPSSPPREIVLALQTIVSRVIDPLQPAVVSITSIHAGEAFNVIPDTVEMRGTIRTLSDAVAEQIQREIRRICEGVAAAQ